jgi:hypothetical protein
MTEDGCAALLHPGDLHGGSGSPEPPEYCPEPVVYGTEHCYEHQGAEEALVDEDDWWWDEVYNRDDYEE